MNIDVRAGSDIALLSIAEAAGLIAAKKLSPVDLAAAAFRRIAALDDRLHSHILVLEERGMAAARQAEAEIAAGRSRGALHGIPVGLKDIYNTRRHRHDRGTRRCSPVTCLPTTRLRSPNCGMPARCSPASCRRGSSPSAAPASTCPGRRRATRGISTATRPARRRARVRRSRPACAWARWAPIPAGRSAGLLRIAASPGTSRPTGW